MKNFWVAVKYTLGACLGLILVALILGALYMGLMYCLYKTKGYT